jgi:hypothetical protein
LLTDCYINLHRQETVSFPQRSIVVIQQRSRRVRQPIRSTRQ